MTAYSWITLFFLAMSGTWLTLAMYRQRPLAEFPQLLQSFKRSPDDHQAVLAKGTMS
jgi:hypothetical protein